MTKFKLISSIILSFMLANNYYALSVELAFTYDLGNDMYLVCDHINNDNALDNINDGCMMIIADQGAPPPPDADPFPSWVASITVTGYSWSTNGNTTGGGTTGDDSDSDPDPDSPPDDEPLSCFCCGSTLHFDCECCDVCLHLPCICCEICHTYPCECPPKFNELSEEYDCSDGYSYEQEYPRDFTNKKFDCSEWAYFIIKESNPTLAADIDPDNGELVNTTTFKNYIYAHGGFRTTNPKVGDIVMWSGHIEFVAEVNGEKFVMHGCRSTRYCAPSYLGKSDNGYIWLESNYDGIDGIATGEYLGFWTPN